MRSRFSTSRTRPGRVTMTQVLADLLGLNPKGRPIHIAPVLQKDVCYP
uniref:Uncharacterized protein n=1 Tax=uncultured bacterium 5G4 TaxID=1701326 RepID=A0A166H2M1_9BACT|nr:hypothetical protein 5G4_005 [uncultured bacterium 5G4]